MEPVLFSNFKRECGQLGLEVHFEPRVDRIHGQRVWVSFDRGFTHSLGLSSAEFLRRVHATPANSFHEILFNASNESRLRKVILGLEKPRGKHELVLCSGDIGEPIVSGWLKHGAVLGPNLVQPTRRHLAKESAKAYLFDLRPDDGATRLNELINGEERARGSIASRGESDVVRGMAIGDVVSSSRTHYVSLLRDPFPLPTRIPFLQDPGIRVVEHPAFGVHSVGSPAMLLLSPGPNHSFAFFHPFLPGKLSGSARMVSKKYWWLRKVLDRNLVQGMSSEFAWLRRIFSSHFGRVVRQSELLELWPGFLKTAGISTVLAWHKKKFGSRISDVDLARVLASFEAHKRSISTERVTDEEKQIVLRGFCSAKVQKPIMVLRALEALKEYKERQKNKKTR